ncbi:MAG: serine/threonine-protein kinase [Candidatus Dormibacteria bacterium]
MAGDFGKYHLLAEVGRGGTGVVYLAVDPDLDRSVAIKVLGASMIGIPGFLDRFRAEAAVMARVEHPNCVRVFDVTADAAHGYLVMEYVDGASLREVLRQSSRLTPEQALEVLRGALSGLGHMHDLGVVHRDVKPENVLCDRMGISKLADFGLAVPTGTGEGGEMFGSPNYMSPELVRGGSPDARTDVYSCGAMLYELLTGVAPYAGGDARAVMRQHLAAPPPDPRAVRAELPQAVADLVTAAMAKDPAARPASAKEFADQLEGVATAAYGKDWRNRGALLRLVSSAVAAGTASSMTLGSAAVTGAGGAGLAVGTAAVTQSPGALPPPYLPPVAHPAATVDSSPPRPSARRPSRARRLQIATGILIVIILLALVPVVLANRSSHVAVRAKLDSCVVGTWKANRIYFALTDNDFHLVARLPGGGGEVFSVAADGNAVSDFTLAAPFTGTSGGHRYTVVERGRAGATVQTASDTVTVSAGRKIEGTTFVADRDGSFVGQGTPQETRLSNTPGSTVKRSCAGDAMSFIDGAYVSLYHRISATPAPVISPPPCGQPGGDANFSFCPSRAAAGTPIALTGKIGCLGPGVTSFPGIKKPTVEVTIYTGISVIARGDFLLDKSGRWSGVLIADPATAADPGLYQIGGGCHDAGINVQNGFGMPYGPLPFTLLPTSR